MIISYSLAVARLLPDALYSQFDTYDNLVRTWYDLRPVPTEAELQQAWAEIEAEHETEATNTVNDELEVIAARSRVKVIPGWATWDEATALNWHDQRLNDAVIDAVGSLAEAKVILKHIATENRAIVRMLMALRDHTWPGLDRD